ncbi:hypothetical protein AOE01nite_27220 [Acetobacter oeni]|uniref:LysR substrate-binding domain-containing protein n=1 Tax=Acetobacter oeni TaxID=304077 RepID=A0A511XNH3_9PROT|nr:LysR substrate-binding domain-containing protein [Acetobacter oeni]MBB3884324.1 DNA-binding transcriptional LysR family regulator [Acetobacter oeni]GEN64498.1 hypothetical protein AOE01nite_27220 [Acetobacter oeni]
MPLALLSKDMRCRQLVDIGFQAIGIEPRVRLETSSLELIHAEVMSGRVATILPTSSFPLRVPPQSRIKIRRLPGFSPGFVGIIRLSLQETSDFASDAWKAVQKMRLQDDLGLLCEVHPDN